MHTVSRIALVLCAAALVISGGPAAASACVPRSLPPIDPRAVSPASPNPLLGVGFFVDHDAKAYRAWRHLRRKGRQRAADVLFRLASQPKFAWFGRFTRPHMRKKIRTYIARARCAGTVPLMTVMRHQGTRCGGGYTGGGPAEDARTRRWYRRFARAVGPRRVVIAFEPDSIGTLECLVPSRRDDRLRLLRYGVDTLSRLPGATIYLEAGASDWESAKVTARKLRRIGLGKVRGFMLNVTHFDWTANNIRHGYDLSRRVGGKPFIVSTAYNGRGPVHLKAVIGGRHRRLNVWCNPQMRGLGPPPTTNTGFPKVDAFMWIGRPGYSAGACNGGPLPVGAWWLQRALMFSRFATAWLQPPPGTHNGLYGRHSPRELGYCGPRCT